MLKKVDFYLDELLLQHSCVVIPGFGGFIANYFVAQYSTTNNLFLPPSKQIIFNKNLISNDGLLCRYIAEKENISFNEAIAKVENTVFSIQQSLQNNFHIELKNVGLLYLDTDNSIQFKLTNTTNFLLESFGLPSFYVHQKQKQVSKLQVKFTDRPAVASEKIKSSSMKKYWPAFVFIPLAIGIVLFQSKTNFLGRLNLSAASWNPFNKISPDTVYIKIDSQSKRSKELESLLKNKLPQVTTAEENTAPIETTEKVVIQAKPETKVASTTSTKKEFKFYIVAGCFQSENNANKLIKKLKSKNINSSIIGKNANGLYRVAISGFETKEQAESELLQVKNDIETAWILSL